MEVSTAQAPMAGSGADWVPIGDVRWMAELLFPGFLLSEPDRSKAIRGFEDGAVGRPNRTEG